MVETRLLLVIKPSNFPSASTTGILEVVAFCKAFRTLMMSESGLVESSGGPARKYYRLTAMGVNHLAELKREWFEMTDIVNKILRGE